MPLSAVARQLGFLAELDRLKTVLRQSRIADGSRRENTAEHSWHVAMFALVLAEHVPGVDPLRAARLLLLHDIVEIDVGDAPIHGPAIDRAALAVAERAAAARLFGLLPEAQGREMLALWLEFEDGATADARFARAIDRLQPLLLNTLTGGGTWTENDVSQAQVIARLRPPIEAGAPALWPEAERLIRAWFARPPAA